jgi:hypothetical protein
VEKYNNPLTILNLSGKLPSELQKYFSDKNALVIDPLESSEKLIWTHIITKDINDFSLINKTYSVTKNNRKIISLSKVSDLQNFTANNGNLILDEYWFNRPMGHFILDKYFLSYGGITLGDNYPAFKEIGSFNIANPFNTGEYLDQMTQKAFEAGVDALSIKSYFDHLIMYAAGLRRKEKAGLPFEVTYGSYEDIFGVQVHFFSRQLELMDVSTCLSSTISMRPEEYYLNVAVQSADFFDFSFIPDVNKVIVTALWTKDIRIKFENRGLSITSLKGGIPIAQYENLGNPSSLTISENEMSDFSDKIIIPSELTEDVTNSLVRGFSENSDSMSKVEGEELDKSFDSFDVSGGPIDEQPITNIKSVEKNDLTKSFFSELNDLENGPMSSESRQNNVSLNRLTELELDHEEIKGTSSKINKIGPLESEDVNDQNIFSGKSVLHNDKTIVKAQKDLEDINLKPNLTDPLDELMNESPLLKRHRIVKDLVDIVKNKFDEDKDLLKINGEKFDLQKVVVWISDHIDKTAKEKDLRLKSISDKIPTHIKMGLFEYAKKLKKPIEKFENKDVENFQNKVVPEIIRTQYLGAFEEEGSLSDVQSDLVDQLSAKLQQLNLENEKLKASKTLLDEEINILKDSRSKMARAQMEAIQASSKLNPRIQATDDDKLRTEFSKKLKIEKRLNENDSQALSLLLERESSLIEKLKQDELKVKKLTIESLKKETMFSQELEKSERMIKAKDLMITKTKETYTKLVERKDKQISEIKDRMDHLSKSVATNSDQSVSHEVGQIEKQNHSLNRQLDNYRTRIASLTQDLELAKSQDHSDEIRKLNMQNQQMKNKVDFLAKETEKLKSKNSSDLTILAQLREEKQKLEQQLKKVSFESKETSASASTPSSQQGSQIDKETRRLQLQNQVLETQVKDSLLKITNLENKLADVLRSQKPSGPPEESNKVKMNQLEGSMKKITQDLFEVKGYLNESKKEANKLRQEKTALENQMEKLKKESNKGKSGSKKLGGKVA